MTIWLILAIFAAYRLAQMATLEDGPFDLFALWRDLVGVEKQSNWVQRGFGCPDCVSFWTSLLAALVLSAVQPVTLAQFALYWIGIAGACLLLNRLTKKLTE